MIVLVLGGESAVASRWAAILEESGHQVLGPASTVTQALELAVRRQPDLVVMSFEPREAGEAEAADEIVQRLRTPTLVLSGLSQEPRRLALTCHVQ